MSFNRELLFGRWFRSESDDEGGQITEYAELSADGSFEFSFSRFDSHGKLLEQSIELGDWGLVGDIHFTFTKSEFIDEQHYAADLADPNNYHAYKVLILTNSQFQYQHVVTQEVFNLKRVIDKIGHC
ncbi:hypothetical protein [Thalassotalea ganghwensis]